MSMTPNIFTRLDAISEHLYLTGSRFFGNHKPSSDWDFFAQHTPEVERKLIELGFTSAYGCGYNDPLGTEVLIHKDGIHIQLVNDVEIKIEAQDYIKELGLLRGCTSKEEVRLVWLTTIKIVTDMTDLVDEICREVEL